MRSFIAVLFDTGVDSFVACIFGVARGRIGGASGGKHEPITYSTLQRVVSKLKLVEPSRYLERIPGSR